METIKVYETTAAASSEIESICTEEEMMGTVVESSSETEVQITEENSEEISSESEQMEAVAEVPEDEDLVLIRDYIPDIYVELKYATEENFTGQVIYDFDEPQLRYGTVKKLQRVQEILAEEGCSLLIWDAFRPSAAQFKLWEVFPDSTYVANPYKGHSKHSNGGTVDVSIVGLDGSYIEVPTEFDSFSSKADRDYSDCNEEARAHAQLLESVMKECGFEAYYGEWWHFSDETSYAYD